MKPNLLWTYENGPSSDFRYIHEELHRLYGAKFYLKGEGGPMTPYRTRMWTDYGYGSKNRILTRDQAKEWALGRGMGPTEYENIFNEPYPEKEKDG